MNTTIKWRFSLKINCFRFTRDSSAYIGGLLKKLKISVPERSRLLRSFEGIAIKGPIEDDIAIVLITAIKQLLLSEMAAGLNEVSACAAVLYLKQDPGYVSSQNIGQHSADEYHKSKHVYKILLNVVYHS